MHDGCQEAPLLGAVKGLQVPGQHEAVGHTQLEHDHLAGDQVAGYQDVGHEDILWVHVHQEWYTSYLGNIYCEYWVLTICHLATFIYQP